MDMRRVVAVGSGKAVPADVGSFGVNVVAKPPWTLFGHFASPHTFTSRGSVSLIRDL